MKAIILAAGQGTRLKKYTKNLPKGMLMFMGKTIIERQIDILKSCGIDEIIIVKGFAGHQINYESVKYYTNEEYESTNMVMSLLAARAEFDDDIIVSYSDILYDKEMLQGMIEAHADFTVAVDDNWKQYWQMRYGTYNFDTESLKIDSMDNIISLGEENPDINSIDARYVGLLKFSKRGIQNLVSLVDAELQLNSNKPWKSSGKAVKQAYMTDLLQALLESGEEVKAVRFNGGWIEFDTNEDYEKAIKWAKDGNLNKFIKIV